MSYKRIITILGPTATGKTRVAVQLARAIDAEIVSADSRQVYQQMDLGTGKDLSEYLIDNQRVRHHLIDIVAPGVEYNVFQYQQAAMAAIRDIQSRGKQVILCGGSGMYIEALLKGYKLFPVPPNPALRQQLERHSDEELATMLATFRPLHNHTDTCEHDRLVKALEIEHYYAQHPDLQEVTQPIASVIFGLCGDRDLIRSKITQRLRERLEGGMIDEVARLLDSGVNPEQLIRYGLEYKFVTLYLQKSIDYDTLFTKLNTAIHQFSKRQMTWFRKMERIGFQIHWIDISASDAEKIEKMRRFL